MSASYSKSLLLPWSMPPLKNREVHQVLPEGFAPLIQSLRHQQDHRQPFYILDLAAVERLTNIWAGALPNVVPYYAVKCNPQPLLITALAEVGAHFDCASLQEIKSVMAHGVDSKKIVFANPFKSEAHIQHAAKVGVNLTTFDSIHELEKIKRWHPKCHLLLRIKPPNDEKGSWRPLGTKFGALPGEVVQLLQHAHGAGLRVVGVSFHVGSKANDPELYRGAIASSRGVFDVAAQLKLPPMHVLNIGGGFQDGPRFIDIAAVVQSAISEYFSECKDLHILAEPGRFFSETAFTLVTNIIGKRVRGDKREYWIDDGNYGSFNPSVFDKSSMMMEPIKFGGLDLTEKPTFLSTVFGPTCDSLDVVMQECQLPELDIDDVLVFYNMGAYTNSAGTKFNGFDISAIFTHLAYVRKSESSDYAWVC